MPTFANTTPIAATGGMLYASAVPLTPTEADIYNGTALDGQDPVPVAYGQAIVAVVQLTPNGIIVGNSTYVVMQTDVGDGVWIDVAWCFFNGTQAPATFVLCGGGAGSINNAFQQSRNAGSVPNPQASGSNAMPLGGRVRFVGRTVMSGGSSAAPGVTTQITAPVRYKLLGLT